MFDKILIANRGEIACRVIKTARRMGIRTVAVYSQVDAGARHVRLADEAILIGSAPARDSYLAAEKILAACRQTGAQAVHPGYGFLSENGDFAEMLAGNGIVFIGPSAAAIRAMGSKSEARKLMEKAGVPLTPGYHGDDQAPAWLKQQADAIGYPVLIKAAAGGGGKGMRVVDRSEAFLDALESCRREAAASFGDTHVLIEKYLLCPRHIEMQVFGDRQGNCIYLFERDCSVQRRHQKVLEEAPAPGMSAEKRAAMGLAAVEAARAVGYVGAGTVEFIVDRDGSFYFMEMNTRLQVEHPVTEMITGLDLVEWQLRVAAGETLPLTQEQLAIHGHALEARIYAEDPAKDFLPSCGRLIHWATPAESLHLRVDSGVDSDDEISMYYDPMLAKLIVWDENREQALARMRQALSQSRIVGVANNIDFLSRLVACPSFRRADLDTGLIERERSFLFAVEGLAAPSGEVWLLAALADLLRERAAACEAAQHDVQPNSPWHLRDGWRLNSNATRRLIYRCGDVEKAVLVSCRIDHFRLELDSRVCLARGTLSVAGELRADLDGRVINATVVVANEQRHVFHDGRTSILASLAPLFASTEGDGTERRLFAPMPGKIVALLARPGDRVKKGAPLLVLEAMKMEHTLSAPAPGVVRGFYFGIGDQVSDGVELVDFDFGHG